MMLRPRWVLALLLSLAVAAGFAVLGHWQLDRAIESGVVVVRTTERVLPLQGVAKPDGPLTQVSIGQMVSVDGAFVPGDEQIVSKRFNGGEIGFWVVSHFTTVDSVSLAVARGWAPDQAGARRAVAELSTEAANAPLALTGRFLPGEAPVVPDESADPHEQTTVSPATLINQWADFTDQSVYSGYVVDASAPAGLTKIDSPVPEVDKALNWLNIFYAIEWVVFAGFAVFLWYRLVKDAVEREEEEAAEHAATGT